MAKQGLNSPTSLTETPVSTSPQKHRGRLRDTYPTLFISTRGCSPWRPAAVMGTPWHESYSLGRIFKGRRGRTGPRMRHAALPAVQP